MSLRRGSYTIQYDTDMTDANATELIRAPPAGAEHVTVDTLGRRVNGYGRRRVDVFQSDHLQAAQMSITSVTIERPTPDDVMLLREFECLCEQRGRLVADDDLRHTIPNAEAEDTWLLVHAQKLTVKAPKDAVDVLHVIYQEHHTYRLRFKPGSGDRNLFKRMLRRTTTWYDKVHMCVHGSGRTVRFMMIGWSNSPEITRVYARCNVALVYVKDALRRRPCAWDKHRCVTLGGAAIGLRGSDGVPFRLTPDQCTALRLIQTAMLSVSADVLVPQRAMVAGYEICVGYGRMEHLPIIVNRASIGTGKTSIVSAIVANMAMSWTKVWLDFIQAEGRDRFKALTDDSMGHLLPGETLTVLPTVLIVVGNRHSGLIVDLLNKISGQSACDGAALATREDVNNMGDSVAFFRRYSFVVISQNLIRDFSPVHATRKWLFPLLIIEEDLDLSRESMPFPPSTCVLVNNASLRYSTQLSPNHHRKFLVDDLLRVMRYTRHDMLTGAYIKYWAIDDMQPIVRHDVRHRVIVVSSTNSERRGLHEINSPTFTDEDLVPSVECVSEIDILRAFEVPARVAIDRHTRELAQARLQFSMSEAMIDGLQRHEPCDVVADAMRVALETHETNKKTLKIALAVVEAVTTRYARQRRVAQALIDRTPVECPVCMSESSETVVQTCAHTMCLECYTSVCMTAGIPLNSPAPCPSCRTRSVGWIVKTKETVSELRMRYGSKADVLVKICTDRITETPDAKIIIVCQNPHALKRAMHIIEEHTGMTHYGAALSQYENNHEEVTREVAAFRNHVGSCVLLLNDTSCSAGMDFDSAFMIFIGVIHKENSQVDYALFEQFMGRVVRGKRRTIDIVHILYNESVELDAFCRVVRPALLKSGHSVDVGTDSPDTTLRLPCGNPLVL